MPVLYSLIIKWEYHIGKILDVYLHSKNIVEVEVDVALINADMVVLMQLASAHQQQMINLNNTCHFAGV